MKVLLVSSLWLILSACSLQPHLSKLLQVQVQPDPVDRSQNWMESLSSPLHGFSLISTPTSVTEAGGMDCLVVNVNGPGISSDFQSSDGDPIPWDCLNIGSYSTMVRTQTASSNGITLKVPSGSARLFQLLGVSTGTGISACDGLSLPDLLRSSRPAVFEIGRQTVRQLYNDGGSLTISSQFSPTGTQELSEGCLQLTPAVNLIYAGNAANIVSNFTESLSGTLPLANASNGSSMTSVPPISGSAGVSSYSSPGIVATAPGISTYSSRIDVLFDATSVKLSQFQQMEITVTASGGTSAYALGSCSSAVTWTSGFEAKVWLGSAPVPGWSVAHGINTGIPFEIDETSDVLPKNVITSESEAGYVHLSIRSNARTAVATCSNLKVDQVKLTLKRVQ